MGRTASDGAAIASRAAQFDYASLGATVELKVRQRARAIGRRVDRRSMVGTARNVVRVGLWLQTIRRCLGCHRFHDWYTAVFRWKQPRVSKFMRSARMFRGVDSLDNFDPTALYVLSTKHVACSARSEAIDRARAGERITKALAELIVDQHRGLPETANDLQRACDALRRVRSRVDALGPAGVARLAAQIAALRRCWRGLDAVLSAGARPAGNFVDPKPPQITGMNGSGE